MPQWTSWMGSEGRGGDIPVHMFIRLNLERLCKEEWSQIPFSVFYNIIKC